MWCLFLSFFVFAQTTTPGAQPPQVGAPLPNQGYQPGIPSQAAPSNSPTYQIDPSAQPLRDQDLTRPVPGVDNSGRPLRGQDLQGAPARESVSGTLHLPPHAGYASPSAQDQVLARLRDKVYRLDGNYAKTLRLRIERKNILLQGSVATEKEKERVFQTVKEQAPAGYSVLNQILVR